MITDLTPMERFERMVQSAVPNLKTSFNGNWIGSCPHSQHQDTKPSFSVHFEKMVFNCFGCGFKGGAVDFAKFMGDDPRPYYSKEYQRKNGGKQAALLAATVTITPDIEYVATQQSNTKKTPHYDQLENWDLVPVPEEKVRQNWSLDAVNELQVLWSEKYRGLVFLILDSDHGYKGAYLHKPEHPKAKTRFTKGVISQVYPKFLFPEYSPDRPLYICEGLNDCITLRSRGFQVCSFTAGAMSTPKDLSLLEPWNSGKAKEVVFVSDNDSPGRKGQHKQATAHKKQFPLMSVYTTNWKDEEFLKLHGSLPDGCDISDVTKDVFDDLLWTKKEYELDKIGGFTVLTGVQANATKPERIEYIIEYLLPLGFNILTAGETGCNKSYCAMQKAMSIANDENEFLGFKIVRKNLKVLYVDTECGEVLLHNRFKQLVKNFKPWTGSERFNMISKVGRTEDIWSSIHEAIEMFKPDYVIVDCLYNCSTSGRLDKSDKVSQLTDQLTLIKSKYGITVEAIHHFVKAGRELGLVIERVAGSAALNNWAEHIVTMMNVPSEPSLRFLRIVKSRAMDYPRDYYGLSWNADLQWLTNEGVVNEVEKFLIDKRTKDVMMKYLSDLKEIAVDGEFQTKDALNIGETPPHNFSRSTAIRRLNDMARTGFLKKNKHGKWKVTNMKLIDEEYLEQGETLKL